MDVVGKLRARSDWREHFETLEIAVRVDVGVSSGEHGFRFFVNEITRLVGYGYMFSSYLASPYMILCRGVADALARYL